jgi:hypothetical protein
MSFAPGHISAAIRRRANLGRTERPARLCWYGWGRYLGGAGIDDQLAGGAIKGADHRPLLGLIAPAFGPGTGEIGMGERLRFVAEQQGDVASRSLLLQQAQAQATALDRIGILPALQRVARPAPGKAPFFSTALNRDFEMRSPVRFSISSARRGKVQFGRSDTPGASSSSITDKAARAFFGSGPDALRARRPATPSRPKIQRQCRTLSGCAQKAAAIRSLVHPPATTGCLAPDPLPPAPMIRPDRAIPLAALPSLLSMIAPIDPPTCGSSPAAILPYVDGS